MIERLSGPVAHRQGNFLVIDVGGVGYGVETTETAARRLAPSDAVVVLWTYTHVREDVLRLFGFPTLHERELFELLISVNGVGPRIGMAILSHLDAASLCAAILAENVERLEEVPGIGSKQSRKVILDLKPKLEKLADAGRLPRLGAVAAAPGPFAPEVDKSSAVPANIAHDLRSALANLGYKEREIGQVLKRLTWDESVSSFEKLLRQAIAEMSAVAAARRGGPQAAKLDELF